MREVSHAEKIPESTMSENIDKDKTSVSGAAGHRQRVFDDIKKNGVSSLNDRHLLETLLFYVIKRQDTRPTAVALLDEFGSFDELLNASHDELTAVQGVGESSAVFLELIGETLKRSRAKKDKKSRILSDIQSIEEFFREEFEFDGKEHFSVLFLDSERKIIRSSIFKGTSVGLITVNQSMLTDMNEWKRASYVAVAHTHPDGELLASNEDVVVTNNIKEYARFRNVEVIGHFILNSDNCIII